MSIASAATGGTVGKLLGATKAVGKFGLKSLISGKVVPQALGGAAIGGISAAIGSNSNNPNNYMKDIGTGMARGAMVGAAVGVGVLGARRVTKKYVGKIGEMETRLLIQNPEMGKSEAAVRAWGYTAGRDIFNTGLGAGLEAADTGLKAGKMLKDSTAFFHRNILDRPKVALAAAGVLGGGWAYSQGATPHGGQDVFNSPTLSGERTNIQYDKQAIAAESIRNGVSPMGSVGTAPQMANAVRSGFENSTVGLVQGLHAGRH